MDNTEAADNGHFNHKRRIADYRVLPLLVVGFASYQLDRTNIGSALTGNFASIISVNQNTINLGNQLMFLGVIVFEIPSNIILHKVGPRQWISAQVCIFGIIACLQVLVRNKLGFLLTRTFLGLAEAGYIPGAMYTLSTWYTKEELTKRIAIFFFGMFGGTAISPLLGAALLKLDGKSGLFGWQWIFLVEGLFSVVVSIILFFFLPEHKEISVSSNQVQISECGGLRPMQKSLAPPGKTHISFKMVWMTLTNVRKWPHFIATGCVFATWSPLTTYTPSIFVELGFTRIKANALCAIGGFLTLPVIVFFAWMSDKSNKRGLTVMVAIFVYLIALVILRTLMHRVDTWGKFGLWTTVNALAVGYHPIHNSWIQINCKSSEERSISVALVSTSRMFVMAATAGLMAGTQIFRADEAAIFYPRGVLIMIGLVILGLIVVFLQISIYWIQNRRIKAKSGSGLFNVL
ncbi:Major facilitator superfamily domain, general substrate transporter [Penicillium italicum]|uniref:Major facilitator superfamily domain, general substrate transporter n=1 Tax=Penicillium italicum TaxID=40296 RepID=A0A0A2KPJ1_PENIT|nr:Major facilitator superfamily domain, general substrate transporter [Penicillium italicum]